MLQLVVNIAQLQRYSCSSLYFADWLPLCFVFFIFCKFISSNNKLNDSLHGRDRWLPVLPWAIQSLDPSGFSAVLPTKHIGPVTSSTPAWGCGICRWDSHLRHSHKRYQVESFFCPHFHQSDWASFRRYKYICSRLLSVWKWISMTDFLVLGLLYRLIICFWGSILSSLRVNTPAFGFFSNCGVHSTWIWFQHTLIRVDFILMKLGIDSPIPLVSFDSVIHESQIWAGL